MERGGVLLNHGDGKGEQQLSFIPADVAVRLATLSALANVPGVKAPALGIALADGAVVTVLGIGRAGMPSQRPGDWPLPDAKQAVICRVGSVEIALVGGTVVATGLFEATAEGVRYGGELASTLDVRALYAQAESALWSTRAAHARARVSGPPMESVEPSRTTLLPGPPSSRGGEG